MAANESTKYQINFRAGNALINVYAEDQGEADAGIAWVEEQAVLIATVQGLLDGAINLAAPGGGQVQSLPQQAVQQQRQAPPQQSQAPSGDGGQCPHGNRIFKDGNKKNPDGSKGRYWSAWMCGSRVEGCAPVWNN